MKNQEKQAFLEFIDRSRDDFMTALHEQNWSGQMWMAADDLLKCFDRMKGYIEANEKQLSNNKNEGL